ncbi:MAG: inositol monophosphatase family protein [Myxococcota bacterium]
MAVAAEEAARAAGQLLRSRPHEVRSKKSAVDFVTEVDLASEARVREVLGARTPGVPIQGEEQGGVATGTRWCVDPLDGTTNFVHGYPAYCVSIALIEGATPVVGVIYDPIHDELYRAWRGGGATVNGAPIAVSEMPTVADMLCVTGFPNDFREGAPTFLAYVERAIRGTHGLRRSGSAAMDLATVARGRIDFFWEFRLKPWDTSAGYVLVTEAGGVVTRLDGTAWDPDAPVILASNGRDHEGIVRLLGG